MEIERIIGFTILLGSLGIGVVAVFTPILTRLMRGRRKQLSREAELIHERLGRIEAAVEAIAIEVERQGELQRFAAKLDPRRLPDPRLVERPITPH